MNTSDTTKKGWILGIDEVGRGSLAGPVTIAGISLKSEFPKQTFICNPTEFESLVEDLNLSDETILILKLTRDSKKLSPTKRQTIAQTITKYPEVFSQSIFSCSNLLIDQFGIGICLSHLVVLTILKQNEKCQLHQVLIDGQIKILATLNHELCHRILIENQLNSNYFQRWPDFYSYQKLIIHRENYSDDKYLTVALASNLAKVYRDDLMTGLGLQYPEYLWDQNKGYGTLKHRLAIAKNHNNLHLRQTFLNNILNTLE